MAVSAVVCIIKARAEIYYRSDWTLDVTHPGVDAEEGWQYAQSFNDPEDQWLAEQPPQLERLLSGNGVVAAGLGSPSRSSSRNGSGSSSANPQSWVRRRRWVRVMRRRLDIPPLPFMEPDGAMYHLAADGVMIPYIEESHSDVGDGEGQELGAMQSTPLSSAQDYVARARYLVGNKSRDTGSGDEVVFAVDARRGIAKLERATTELRQGLLSEWLFYFHNKIVDTSVFVSKVTMTWTARRRQRFCSMLIAGS